MANGIDWSTPWRQKSDSAIQIGMRRNAANPELQAMRQGQANGLGVNHPLSIAAHQQSVNPSPPPPGPGWGRQAGGMGTGNYAPAATPYAGHDGTANLWRGVSGGYMKAQGIASMAARNLLERKLDNDQVNRGLARNSVMAGHQPAPYQSFVGGSSPTLAQNQRFNAAYGPLPQSAPPGGLLAGFAPQVSPNVNAPQRPFVPPMMLQPKTDLPTDANLAYGWTKQKPVSHTPAYRGMGRQFDNAFLGLGGGAPQEMGSSGQPFIAPEGASPFLRTAYGYAEAVRRAGSPSQAAGIIHQAHADEADHNLKIAQLEGQQYQNAMSGAVAKLGPIGAKQLDGIPAGTVTPGAVRQEGEIFQAGQNGQRPQVPQVQAPHVNTANLPAPAAATPAGTPAPPQPQPPATPMLPMTSGEGYAHLVNALGTDDFNRIIPADPNARGEIKDVLNRAYSSGYGDRGLNDPNSPLARALRAHLTALYGEDAMNYEATGPHESFWNWAGPDKSPEALRAAAFARGGQKLPTSIKLPTVPKVAAPPQPQRPPGLLGMFHWGY